MKKAQLQELRARLTQLEDELNGKGPARIEPNRTDEARAGGDDDAQPLNEMEQAIASSRNRNAGAMLAQLQRARARMDEDPESFGTCEECGEDIAWGRLKAMPYATLCVTCQSKRDGPRQGPTRKKLTDYR